MPKREFFARFTLVSRQGEKPGAGETLVGPLGRAIDMAERISDRMTEPTIVGYAAGNRIAARYELVSELGGGSMGVVWNARDHELDGEPVALKFLRPGLSADDRFVTAMKHEARKLFKLTHPNISRLLNLSRDETRTGCVFLVMEFIEGKSLRHLLQDSGGGLDPLRVLRWAEQVARAIDHAHEQRILHRDIKPSNILVDLTHDRAVLCDFGIARGLAGDTVGGVGATSGTPEYMSPQQFRGLESPQNDVYSFAATLYECLAGEPPFTGSGPELQRKIDAHAPQPIPGLSDTLNRALLRGLAKDDQERQRTASELVREMKAGLGPLSSAEPAFAGVPAGAVSVHAGEPAMASETPSAETPSNAPRGGGKSHSNAPHPGWWLLAVVLLAGAVIAAVPAWREAGVRTLATWFDPAAAAPGGDGQAEDPLATPEAPAAPSAGVVKGAMDDAALATVELISRDGGRVVARGAVLDESQRAALEGRLKDAGVTPDLSEVRVDPSAVAAELERRLRGVGGRTAAVVVRTGDAGPELVVQVQPDDLINDATIRTVVDQFVYDMTRVRIQRL
jgi:serine/threonine protein kinase